MCVASGALEWTGAPHLYDVLLSHMCNWRPGSFICFCAKKSDQNSIFSVLWPQSSLYIVRGEFSIFQYYILTGVNWGVRRHRYFAFVPKDGQQSIFCVCAPRAPLYSPGGSLNLS